MSLFTNILVAIDGSAASERAFDRAVDEARVWNVPAAYRLCGRDRTFCLTPHRQHRGTDLPDPEKEGQDDLNKAKITAAAKGVTATTHMKQGHAGSEILSLGAHEKVDLIVVGSHGKSRAYRILIGSASTFVVTHSSVTTMVVRS